MPFLYCAVRRSRLYYGCRSVVGIAFYTVAKLIEPAQGGSDTAFRIIVILAACAVVIAILVTRFVGKNDGEESNPHIVVVGQSGATALPTLKRERLETCGYDGDGVLKLDVNDTEIELGCMTLNQNTNGPSPTLDTRIKARTLFPASNADCT